MVSQASIAKLAAIFAPQGLSSKGGMNGKAELLNCDGTCAWEHAFLSYDIYIEDGFDWVQGGKLPGSKLAD